MATPTCIKCGSHRFEMVEFEPTGTAFKLMSVQCAQCGGVVGVMDYMNIGDSLVKLHHLVRSRP